MANLTFHRTLTPAQFKQEFNITKVDIVQNPKEGGKVFFDGGVVSGAISGEWKDEPVFSEVCGEDGVMFWMLHKKRTSKNVLETFEF